MEPTTIFPDLSTHYPQAMEEDKVVLNGQKVLFDEKVSLMPTELKKEDNGGARSED